MSDLAPRSPDAGDAEMYQIVASVAVLPLPTDDSDRRWNCRTATVAWLRSRKSRHTRRAYFREISDYLSWSEATGLDPRRAMRADIDAFATSPVCRGLKPSSLARRLSTLSSWYTYLISNGVTDVNPVLAVDRPDVDRDHSPTVGLSEEQASLFMRAARRGSGRDAGRNAAVLGCLIELGMRVGEVAALDYEMLRHNHGHRTVRIPGKGGKFRELPIPPPLGRDLDTYIADRGDHPGPLFITRGGRRIDQPGVFRLVRQVAASAGLPAADVLSPHGLRHTAITAALNVAPLRDVQDMAGHADPRTTRRYDRSRGSLDRSPVYLIANLFAHDDRDEPSRPPSEG